MWRWVLAMSILPSLAVAEVGSITELTGNPAGAKRNSEELVVEEVGFAVEMMDQLITANTRLGITFADNTRVEITEQSELIIDDFVYDPNTGAGKMAMKVALGTVQMTSGNIAHRNRENVNIATPTATIGVRGTDFSMTVDEIGRSLIILLPSCPDPTMDEDECPVGSIEVSTDAGAVILDEKYEGTLVASASMLPSDPRKLLLERANINNNLIIVPPSEFPGGFAGKEEEEEETSTNPLDQDLLEYQELAEDFLQEDLFKYSALDINRLTNNYLDNALDIGLENLDKTDLDEEESTVLPNIHQFSWITSVVNEEQIILDSDRLPHIAVLDTVIDTNGTFDLTQDEYSASIQINAGGTNVSIKVVQKQ